MPEYAVELGTIMLRSNEPITEEQRIAALQELQQRNRIIYLTPEGLTVVIRPRP